MHERPSTSGGPSSRLLQADSFNFDKYDKRVSRDDFYVSLKPEGGLRPRQISPATGTATTGLPTPEASPNSIATSQAQIPVIRLPTPESASDSSSIGMAIGGSPVRQQTASSSQQTLRPVFSRNPTSPLSAVESVGSTESSPGAKKQTGKWKLFGRFGKKHSESAQPSPTTSVSSNDAKGASRPGQASAVPRVEGERNVARNNTVSAPKTPGRHKPVVVRSATMPYMDQPQPSRPNNASASTDTFRGAGNGAPPASGLLNVDIPDSNMERYSIMFGDVLKNNNSASSLLARRQATLNKLKTLGDTPEHPETLREPHRANRRATSPQPMASSSFNLFPLPSTSETAPRPTPRQQVPRPTIQVPRPHAQVPRPPPKGTSLARSNTSPAMLHSPMKATFDDLRPYNHLKDHPKGQMNKGKMTIATLARSREQSVSKFNADESSLILESPTAMDEEGFSPKDGTSSPAVIRSTSVKPQIHEPKWQMINASSQQLPMSGASSITSSRKRSPSSISSAQTHITKPSVDSDTLGELTHTTSNTTTAPRSSSEEKPVPAASVTGMTAVEQSIARQISVSREQRRMLKPLQTTFGSGPRPQPRRGSGPGSGKVPLHISPLPTPKIAMGQNERLAETKMLTPTLVTPRETNDTKLAEHRKSERIVLEG
ncbi:hypothetical protein PG996_010339 [Apiospora saccharicola]|uniref:DUF4045 domain-containing protein n=1 Tax=Apiospora saccharicola TaxID=335842 RepID=A0ABR1URE3_9PEZI